MKDTTTEYRMIVETDKYAGNFEREMCAYITGTTGDCGVGKKCAAMAEEELSPEINAWCDENVTLEPDDKACYRPVSICDIDSTAFEIYMEDIPTKEIFEIFRQRAIDFWSKAPRPSREKIKIRGLKMIEVTTTIESRPVEV